MTDNVFWTVFSGTSVYVLGQVAVKLVIEPVHEMKGLIGSISYDLIYEARLISAPDVFTVEQRAVISDRLRSAAAKLEQQLGLVPGYQMTACVFRLPTRDNVRAAAKALILLSNLVPGAKGETDTVHGFHVQTIRKSLGLYVQPEHEITAEDYKGALRSR